MFTKVWVLTREINGYDQDGEYFECVFKYAPDMEGLASKLSLNHLSMGEAISYTNHVLKGGGRKNTEHQWYHLREFEL